MASEAGVNYTLVPITVTMHDCTHLVPLLPYARTSERTAATTSAASSASFGIVTRPVRCLALGLSCSPLYKDRAFRLLGF